MVEVEVFRGNIAALAALSVFKAAKTWVVKIMSPWSSAASSREVGR